MGLGQSKEGAEKLAGACTKGHSAQAFEQEVIKVVPVSCHELS